MSNSDWGAIPRQLAEDVSLTLKKKFNAQTGFKPVEWNKNIKGLTPLPEKTVSGSIVAFSDAADASLKSCNVTIEPNLNGVSSVNVVQTGKNIVDFSGNINASAGGFTFSKVANGGISFSGTSTGTWAYITQKIPCKIPSGTTITFSRDSVFSFRHYLQLTFDDESTRSMIIPDNTVSISYTLDKDVTHVRAIMSQLTQETAYSGTVYFQLEVGANATTYTEYVQPTTHMASLGRVLYGGSPDVVNGTGTKDYVKVAFSDCTWANVTQYQSNFNADNGIVSVRFSQSAMTTAGYELTSEGVVCNVFVNNGRSVWNRVDRLDEIGFASGLSVNMHYSELGLTEWTDDSATILNAWRSSQYYLTGEWTLKFATPENFTFDPVEIDSLPGDNTLWSDGDLSVIYRYVAGDPSFETVLSSNPLLELTGVSGTDVERTLWTYTATDNCKIKFHSNTQVRTNTGSNDGYFTVKKNDTVILTTYADTSTTTQFPIPDIELESGDTVTITGGFDNYHTSCWFDVYSTITILHVDN